MATIKSYTTIEQSRKLAEILPLESADMYYCYGMDIHTKGWSFDDTPTIIDNSNQIDVHADIPCWSVGALLEVMPSGVRISKNCDGNYDLGYRNFDTKEYLYMIDACYEMIIRLHELNLL